MSVLVYVVVLNPFKTKKQLSAFFGYRNASTTIA